MHSNDSMTSYTEGRLSYLLERDNEKVSSKFSNHFKAILYRKFTLLKRSWKSMIVAAVGSIFFCGLAIIISLLMKLLIHDSVTPVTFNSYMHKTNEIFLVIPPNATLPVSNKIKQSVSILKGIYVNDTEKTPVFTNFSSRDEINEYMYSNAEAFREPLFVAMGLDFSKAFVNFMMPYNFLIYYNGSWSEIELVEEVQLTRVLWKMVHGVEKDFTYCSTRLLKRLCDLMFSFIGPVLICCGLTSMIPLFIFQPITDVKGDVRSYMISCSLSKFPYWLATFLVDCCVWFITSGFAWLMFFAAGTTALMQNKLTSFYIFIASGPSFIMFVYCFSFAFSSAESAPRQAFIMMVILMIIPVVVSLIVQPDQPPLWCEALYSFLPHLSLQRFLTIVCSNIYILKQPFSFYWKDTRSLIFFVGEFTDIILYGIILAVIEFYRGKIESSNTKRSFGDYSDFFTEQKRKHPVTSEANELARKVLEGNEEWAVKIEHVSRLFFNTEKKPIPAVNDVCLGVKKGSIFGFLGANGAGKTTLIKMITSMLPPSEGIIYVNGKEIDDDIEANVLSICPQFNSHLCMEMTPREHLYMYSKIYQISEEQYLMRAERLFNGLGMNNYKDKPAGELSGGEQRKLAIALTFLSPANIVLLDEPTSSLDPVARHNVHEMISSFKGEKTFMLCTHLLSEAESLCDMISIMIKGNVYTCGSPQYLSTKFGTEYKIDIGLEDKTEECYSKIDAFIHNQLPSATLTIKRPQARIYSMPAENIDIAEIFNIMESGSTGDNGYKYYTCSSSSLERVFMEIVHMSESDEYQTVETGKSP